jgi:hypothetical protein
MRFAINWSNLRLFRTLQARPKLTAHAFLTLSLPRGARFSKKKSCYKPVTPGTLDLLQRPSDKTVFEPSKSATGQCSGTELIRELRAARVTSPIPVHTVLEGELLPIEKPAQHLIAEVPHRRRKDERTVGTDLSDVRSHYCAFNKEGVIVGRGRFRITLRRWRKGLTDLLPACVAIEADAFDLDQRAVARDGHEVVVANACARSHIVIVGGITPMDRLTRYGLLRRKVGVEVRNQ